LGGSGKFPPPPLLPKNEKDKITRMKDYSSLNKRHNKIKEEEENMNVGGDE
jgi:hypothetical protein